MQIKSNLWQKFFRNADCAKPALLVANTGDDEEQSLKELEPIGRPQLYERIDLWVRVVSKGLPLPDTHKKWWEKALTGLLEARNFTLELFAEYILKTVAAIENGHPILAALGVAFPALRIPRDSAYFNGLGEKYAGHKSRWKNMYNTAIKKRACYLLKQTPAQTPLTEEVLRKSFEKVRDFVPEDIHPCIEAFIKTPGRWNEQAKNLSDIEWEIVKPVFDGLKREKFNLGKETKRLFDEIGADERLTKDELDYLDLLEKRKTTEPNEEDEEFYQNHRLELDEAFGLKTKWDRFIYGTPVESEDFIVGVALCLEALFDRNLRHRREKLTVRCDRRTKKNFKGLNNEAGRFFCYRYRGLPSLWERKINWDVGHLFEFDDLDREWRAANKSYVNRSVAKSALKLKFFLELEIETSQGDIETSSKHWRKAIREGQCEIFPRGYSHVFVSGPTDCPDCSDFSQIADLDDSFQEVFSRQELRKLVLKYFTDEDPLEIRRDSAGDNIWRERDYRGLSEKNIYSQKEKENASAQRQTKTNGSESGEPKSRKHFFSEDVRKGTEQTEPEETGKTGLVSSIWPYSGVGKLIGAYNKSVADSEKDENWLEDTVKRCKGALQQFQLRSKLLEKALTPNAALLKFQGSSNLTVEQVLKRRSELLTTHRLNIISVRPEPGVVSISVARPERKVLHLLDVWKNWAPDCTSGNHEILIGLKEDDSSLLVFSPKNNAPHTLIAGSTGSGKSVLMQNIILAISCTNTPEQAHIVIIDPKLGVDYFAFENLPHMHGDIIDDQQNAISVLSDLVSEMDRRYSLLRKNKVSNIYELNAKEDATEHPPFLWIIHDEFAEWMMTKEYSAEVSDVVARLGVKARAAGIFLVFAAQRPDVHVMPMQLRANLGNRLILRVDSEGTSEIALGEKGAERLLGKGHLIAKIEGNDGLIAAQVPFIGSDEIEKIVSELNT
jgi:hypothetical protein